MLMYVWRTGLTGPLCRTTVLMMMLYALLFHIFKGKVLRLPNSFSCECLSALKQGVFVQIGLVLAGNVLFFFFL